MQVHPFVHWRKAEWPDEPASMERLAEFSRIDKGRFTPPAYHLNA